MNSKITQIDTLKGALPRNPVTVVPARLASTRLPNKPLALIAGRPMICHVLDRAREAGLGNILVACGDPEIKTAVEADGGQAVLTDPALPSGSDRVYAALKSFDPSGSFDGVINLQGDMPTLSPALIRRAFELLSNPDVDIGTLVCEIRSDAEKNNPAVVKTAVEFEDGAKAGRALYFSRNIIPAHDGPLYKHIGIYVYRRAALEAFVSAPPSVLEQREKLEQLRALALGLRIEAALVHEFPVGVDTPADLEEARRVLERKS